MGSTRLLLVYAPTAAAFWLSSATHAPREKIGPWGHRSFASIGTVLRLAHGVTAGLARAALDSLVRAVQSPRQIRTRETPQEESLLEGVRTGAGLCLSTAIFYATGSPYPSMIIFN